MTTATRKKRGLRGSVRGIPEPEVTRVLVEAAGVLAKEGGLKFTRARATEVLVELGAEGEELDGLLFALQRTIPGVENIGFGQYRLPKEWKRATEHRMLRITLPKLDVLEAIALRKALNDGEALGGPLDELYNVLTNALDQ